MDVSYLIVNFNSGAFLPAAIQSLLQQDLAGRRAEIVVVDSCSSLDQNQYFDVVRAQGARVVRMQENLGYAGGCNRGLAESSGRIVFFLNADVLGGANCIAPLVDVLEQQRDVGMVEPRTFLDPAHEFVVPEITELTRLELLRHAGVHLSDALCRWYVRGRVRRTLPYWRATGPMSVPSLSGAFLGTRRDTIRRLGGFDEAFPLYYEDSDLFRRAKRAGCSLLLVPESHAVHFAHRSAATIPEEALARWRQGRDRYIRKHLGPLSLAAERFLGRLGVARERRRKHDVADGLVDLGARSDPPALHWESPGGPFLLEIAFERRFLVAAGHLGEGNRHTMSPETWASLRQGDYFLRALDPSTLREHCRWHVVRT